MKIFEGKSPGERNKIIAALVLGVMALFALTYTFGGMFFGGKKTVTVSVSPTPTASPSANRGDTQITGLPSQAQVDLEYVNTPVAYNPNSFYAPDAGRNIFAFYEPPPPTPYSPTPLPTPTPYIEVTPVPKPPAPQKIGFFSPQSVYAGSKGFLLEINGENFTPDTRIIFSGSELPTTYVSPQRLTANIPSNFIAGEGQRFIMTRTPDGKLYSDQFSMNVLAPPTPQFQYIGAKLAQRENNNTAYLQEQGKDKPFGARLNDVVGGRFRVMSISSAEIVFEDVNLGFRHRLSLYRPSPGQTTGGRTETQNNPGYINPNTNNPNNPGYQNPVYTNSDIPGIPNNIPRYNPNNSNTSPLLQQQPKQKTEDEDNDRDN
jgi:hypothetical protein